MHRLNRIIQRAQKGRVKAVVVARHLGVIAIDRQQILGQVVTADTKEINLFAALIDDKHHRRHFEHNAQRDLLIKRNMFAAQRLFGIRQLLLHPQNLLHRGNHRDHDFQRAVRRGAQNRPQLGAEQRLILCVNTHRPVAEKRVVLRRNVEVGHRLVAADIHSADDNAAPVSRLQRLAKYVVELVFRGRAGPVHIEHFGAEQAYRLRAVVEGRRRLYRMGDIGRHFQTNPVFRTPLFIQPGLLLATDLRLHPGLLLIVARHRLIGIDHHQPGVTVNLHSPIDPRQQRLHIDAYQSGNIERTREDHRM